jgi:site-specific recombinase XerD
MAITIRNKKYQAYVTYKGERYRKSFGSHNEASLWEAQVRMALANKLPVPNDSVNSDCMNKWTLGTTIRAVENLYWRGSKSEDNLRHTCNAIMRFYGHDKPIHSFITEDIHNYVNSLKENNRSNGTVNRHLAALRKVLKHAVSINALLELPELPKLKEASHRLKWFTKSQEDSIINEMRIRGHHELADMAIVSIDTGMRASELFKFDMQLHPIGENGLGLYIPDRKNGDSLLLPATSRVQAIIKKGRFTRTVKSYRRAWESIRSDLNLEDCVWHTFRHTCCSRLVQGGMDIRKVQQWMGHRNISTTMLYAHLAPNSLLTGVDILEA